MIHKIEHNSLCETESYKGMTDNEIIKALEYKTKVSCELCDLKPDIYCQTCNIGLLKQSLDLINRQKTEITEKDETIKAQADTIFLYEQVIKDKNAEIERLNKEVDRLSQCVMYHDGYIVDAKAEAIKEFVKRLKENIYIVFEDTERMRVVQEVTIDNLVKEMTEQSTMGQVK